MQYGIENRNGFIAGKAIMPTDGSATADLLVYEKVYVYHFGTFLSNIGKNANCGNTNK